MADANVVSDDDDYCERTASPCDGLLDDHYNYTGFIQIMG